MDGEKTEALKTRLEEAIARFGEALEAAEQIYARSEASAEAWRKAALAWEKAASGLLIGESLEAPRIISEATKASLEAHEAEGGRSPFAGEPRRGVPNAAQGRK